jgi:hypothetical protein
MGPTRKGIKNRGAAEGQQQLGSQTGGQFYRVFVEVMRNVDVGV